MPGTIGFPQLDPGHDGGGEPSDGRTNQDSTRTITPEELEFGHDSNAYELAIYEAGQDASAQQPSPDMPPSNDSIFNPLLNKENAIAHNERARREREATRNVQSQSDVQVIPVIPADLASDVALEIVGEEPVAREDWRDSSPLTPGQAQEVDHLLTVETDSLAREVLITLKRDGIPPRSEWNDFMAQYALFSWDSESDAQAWATLAIIANSDWDETTAYADEDHVEAVAQDRANDWIEGLTIIHAGTGDILLDVTGVERADGSQYVGLQDYEVEALKGLPLIFVHNHTKEVGASEEDLDSAFRAGAELLIVITPGGREQVYVRGRGRMVLVRDEQASYEMITTTREEAIELARRSDAQARAFQHDSPEFVFLQKIPDLRDRLTDVVQELNLHSEPTALTVSGLIDTILKQTYNNNLHAFHRAAAVFSSQDETREVYPGDFLELLTGAFPYWKTAEETGVDPLLLAQVVLWEDSARSWNPLETAHFESSYDFLISALRPKSFGPAQIQVPVAVEMLTDHPEAFDDFSPLIDGLKDDEGNWIPKEVARQLWHNLEFSIRVAGVYLMDFETRLVPYLQELGVEVSDRKIDGPFISVYKLRLLAVVGYNQGWGSALADLRDLYNTVGAHEVVNGIDRTLNISHIDNVLSKRNEAFDWLGLY